MRKYEADGVEYRPTVGGGGGGGGYPVTFSSLFFVALKHERMCVMLQISYGLGLGAHRVWHFLVGIGDCVRNIHRNLAQTIDGDSIDEVDRWNGEKTMLSTIAF